MKKEFIKRMLKNSFISIIIIYILISGIYKANLIISTYNIINEFYNMSETEKINMKDKYIEEFNSNPKNIIHYNPICSFTKILINSMKISLEISLLFGIGIGIVVSLNEKSKLKNILSFIAFTMLILIVKFLYEIIKYGDDFSVDRIFFIIIDSKRYFLIIYLVFFTTKYFFSKIKTKELNKELN